MAINIFWIDGFDEIGNISEKYTLNEYPSYSPLNTYASAAGITAPFGYGRFCEIVYGSITKRTPSYSPPPNDTLFAAFHIWAGRVVSAVENRQIRFKVSQYSGSNQLNIELQLDKLKGKFKAILVRGSTDIATWQTPIRFGQWHHLSLRATCKDSGGKVTLSVDGQNPWTYYGDTANSNSPGAGRLTIQYIHTVEKCVFIDNLILGTGLETDPLLPPARVYGAAVPNANVAVSWDPSLGTNWECVDEIPHNSDSDHNSTYTAGNQDVFSHAAIPNLGTDVLAVKVNCISRKDGDTAENIQPLIRVSGTDYYGTAQEQTTSYFSYGQLWQNNPATDLPWTPEEAQSAGFGYRRQ